MQVQVGLYASLNFVVIEVRQIRECVVGACGNYLKGKRCPAAAVCQDGKGKVFKVISSLNYYFRNTKVADIYKLLSFCKCESVATLLYFFPLRCSVLFMVHRRLFLIFFFES